MTTVDTYVKIYSYWYWDSANDYPWGYGGGLSWGYVWSECGFEPAFRGGIPESSHVKQ